MPIQRVLARVLPLVLCFFCSWSWADATAELEELIQNKQWAQAQQRLQTAVQQNPKTATSPQWRLLNSQVLAGQGKRQEAIDVLQALIQEFPELPEPYNNLGVLLAAQGLSEPFLVLNGDTFFEVDLAELQRFHSGHSSDWTFSLFRTSEVGRYMGIEVKSNGEIDSLTSGTCEQSRLANGGVYLVNPSILVNKAFVPGSKHSLEDDLLPMFVAQGNKLFGLEFPGAFIDIGIPQDYFRAAEVLPH